jgi:hypothetical protein
MPSHAKPSQAKPSQAKPSQAKPSQAKPSHAKPCCTALRCAALCGALRTHETAYGCRPPAAVAQTWRPLRCAAAVTNVNARFRGGTGDRTAAQRAVPHEEHAAGDIQRAAWQPKMHDARCNVQRTAHAHHATSRGSIFCLVAPQAWHAMNSDWLQQQSEKQVWPIREYCEAG